MRRDEYHSESWVGDQIENYNCVRAGVSAAGKMWNEADAIKAEIRLMAGAKANGNPDHAYRTGLALAGLPPDQRRGLVLFHECRTLTQRDIERALKVGRKAARRLLDEAHANFVNAWNAAKYHAFDDDLNRPDRRASAGVLYNVQTAG